MGRFKDWWRGKAKDEGAKSYSVQLVVGDEGFMVAQSFTGSTLETLFTQAIWTYICVNRISQDIASFPAIVQTRKPGTDDWIRDYDHDLNNVLDRPYGTNDFAPRVNWQQQLATGVIRQELDGNQYYQKVQSGNRLLALGLYMVQLKANEDAAMGKLFNSYSPEGSDAIIPADQVVNVLHASPGSTWDGVSPGVANEQATRVNYAADRRNRYDLETRVQPGVVFKVKALFTMNDKQRTNAEEWLANQYEGAVNAGKSLVVGDNTTIEGAPAHPVSDIAQKDAAARDKVISSYGVSPPWVGVLDDVKYANLDKAMRIQWSTCIGPRLLNIYNTINTQGIWPVYGRNVRLWYDMVHSPLGLAALAERGEVAAGYQALGWPAMHLNERFALDMKPFEGWDKSNMAAVVAGRVPGEGSGDPAPGDDGGGGGGEDDEGETEE
jgi:phage portal protein BeeE